VPLDETASPELVDDTSPGDACLRRRLEEEIARLPPRQRSVLTLRIFGDLPFREIARIEGITENSAKVSYHHAVKRLKEWFR
jgi:RNA polymerase sigma-70 factor (ECF subfamily)